MSFKLIKKKLKKKVENAPPSFRRRTLCCSLQPPGSYPGRSALFLWLSLSLLYVATLHYRHYRAGRQLVRVHQLNLKRLRVPGPTFLLRSAVMDRRRGEPEPPLSRGKLHVRRQTDARLVDERAVRDVRRVQGVFRVQVVHQPLQEPFHVRVGDRGRVGVPLHVSCDWRRGGRRRGPEDRVCRLPDGLHVRLLSRHKVPERLRYVTVQVGRVLRKQKKTKNI